MVTGLRRLEWLKSVKEYSTNEVWRSDLFGNDLGADGQMGLGLDRVANLDLQLGQQARV